jgi:hypothetical protein
VTTFVQDRGRQPGHPPVHGYLRRRALARHAHGPRRPAGGAAASAHPRIGGLGQLLGPGSAGTGQPVSRHPGRSPGPRSVPARAVVRRA